MIYQNHAINRIWNAEGKIELYRREIRIRRFEQKSLQQFSARKMADWRILSIGPESITLLAELRKMAQGDFRNGELAGETRHSPFL